MGFEFGILNELNPTTSLVSFLAVVFFIIVSDNLIGMMEYLIAGSVLYNKMVLTKTKNTFYMNLKLK
jgi:hypothetical protein